MRALSSRLLSPSGFVLAGLLLLLPFVGVSCSDPELGTLDGSYTGLDLVTGGEPSYEVDGPVAEVTSIEQVQFPDPGAQLLTILLIVLLILGMAAALLPVVQLRTLATAAIAAVAAVLLTLIQLVAQSNLVTSMQLLLLHNLFTVPQDLARVATRDYLADATGSRIGFWLCLVALLALVAINIVLLAHPRRGEPTGGAPSGDHGARSS